MTFAPPLSACLIIILESFANDDSDFCSEVFIFRLFLTYLRLQASSGIFIVFSTKVSNSCSLPLGGTKFDLFLTRDSSSSSMPSKYSTSRTLRLNSDNVFCQFLCICVLGCGGEFETFS